MRVSEVIKQLQRLQRQAGDVDMVHPDPTDDGEFFEPTFSLQEIEYFGKKATAVVSDYMDHFYWVRMKLVIEGIVFTDEEFDTIVSNWMFGDYEYDPRPTRVAFEERLKKIWEEKKGKE